MSDVTLTGWKAVVVLVIIAGFAGFRMYSARTALETEGRETLEMWVRSEVIAPILADTTAPLEERGAALLGASDLSIRTIAARGPLDDMVVKVELDPNPAYPPGTELVRYYRMSYSTLTGWMWEGNASVVSWYLAAF